MAAARVILIEDHLMVQEFFSQLLAEMGLREAARCATLAEAQETLPRLRPDLAIVDWQLPDGRGLDLIRRFKAELPGTRWLVVTASEQEAMVREAVALGVNGCVVKRSSTAVLREAIGKILAGEIFYCPVSSRLALTRLVKEHGENLSAREREVLRRFAGGENPKAIAQGLGMTVKTAQNHLAALKEKLGLREPADLVRYAIKHGYIDAP